MELVAPPLSDVDSESELISEASTDKGLLTKARSTLQTLKENVKENTDEDGQKSLKKELTLFSGVAYVVGLIIGSGIFITPKTILCQTGSFGLSMIVWVIGGIVAMTGGLCYIELGLLIRKSGGELSYIKETYSFKKKYKGTDVLGSLLSFLYLWASLCIIRATSLAVITLTCARYLIRPFFIECEDVPEDAVKLLSICVLGKNLKLSGLSFQGEREGARSYLERSASPLKDNYIHTERNFPLPSPGDVNL